jgi:hypothetical protein
MLHFCWLQISLKDASSFLWACRKSVRSMTPKNLRGGLRFSTHHFHEKLLVIVFGQVPDRTDDNARAKEEVLFCGGTCENDPT